MGVLISQTLLEKQFHNFIAVNAKIKFSKHLEQILEIFIDNIKYFSPTHFSIVKIGFFKKSTKKIIDENGITRFLGQIKFLLVLIKLLYVNVQRP